MTKSAAAAPVTSAPAARAAKALCRIGLAAAGALVAAGRLSGAAPTASPAAGPREALRTPPPETRRVAIRAPGSFFAAGGDLERLTSWARRAGVRIETADESVGAPPGWEVVRVAVTPASPDFARRLAKFGVRADAAGFSFDGRDYRSADDAIAVRDPALPAETLIVANGRQGALRLAGRRIFLRDGPPPDYQVLSGDLGKSGRFAAAPGTPGSRPPLTVDRKADKDDIGARESFLKSLVTIERPGVEWRFAEADRPAVALLEPVLAKFRRRNAAAVIHVRIFPDPSMKAHATGSSRPADVVRDGKAIRVDVDASAPAKPDLVTPVLAAAAFAAENPRLLDRPLLLLALGARASGRFWERDVASFAAFAERAGAGVSVGEAVSEAEDVSPILAAGCAASWLEAGVRKEGEAAVLRDLADPEPALSAALARWRTDALHARTDAPARRPFPSGFLRGVSYAMSNSVEAGYASPRSRETLARIARLGANSVSVMSFAFAPDAARPELSFVHRNPQGETDEATVHAVTDARRAGMTAMVKPQIWVGNGVFTGTIAMKTEEDWARWFARYRRFIVHHAIVAEASGAAAFCVGTELIATENRVAQWRETIAAVRLATGAPLTYASNWATGAVKVLFWDALDLIGVDFYDPLTADPAASDAALEAGARAATRPLEALSRRLSKPVVFTEAGYPLCRGAWMTPHDENTGRPAETRDAARAIAAVYRALGNEPWWRGVYWWKAFSSGREARADERGFNILGGAPEKAVSEGFARLARERAAKQAE